MKNIYTHKVKVASAAVVASLLVAACGGGGGGGSSSSGNFSIQGTLRVALTDSPACGLDALNVTVTKIRAHSSATATPGDSGWTDITVASPQKINLLDLTNGALSNLGQTALPAGHYAQLRLVLSSNASANTAIPTGGVETGLILPSGTADGIKLTTSFDVAGNQTVDLILDFDACQSVVPTTSGTYALRPVITVFPKLTSGGVTGFVDSSTVASKPIVTAQRNGVVIKSTIPDPVTGAFTLYPLTQSSSSGNYDVVITANLHAAAVVAAVPVTAGANVAVSGSGGSTPPIALATSTSHTVRGVITPSNAEGHLRAIQSLSPAAPITITTNSQAATLATGTYVLNLPTAAPFWGSYGAGSLPIALSQAPTTVAGKYTVEASAAGFQTQTRNENVAGADVDGVDFALLP